MLQAARAWMRKPIWPEIDYELTDVAARGYLKGVVINIGAGSRDISHLIDGELVNLDITYPGDTRTHIHIVGPAHAIPRPDNTFDGAISIAVLEHVDNPEACVAEMFRVLKPGARAVVSVPFLQPEHLIPTDFQRYTKDGLSLLLTRAGFVVEEISPMFSVYHTLHWIVDDWLKLKNTVTYKALRVILLSPLGFMARRSKLTGNTVASVFRVIARKP